MREVIDALDSLEHPRVLVVGDLILDEYVVGTTDRISPEAPIPVLTVREEEERLGGAGNVAANLAALGAETYLVGVLGDDATGDRYERLCAARDVRLTPLRVDDRPTIRKTRHLAHNSQQVLRVDRERVAPLEQRHEEQLLELALDQAGAVDIILLSDYAKGALPERVLRQLFAKARQRGIKAIVDPKRTDFKRYYANATLVKPNRREAARALGRPLDDKASLEAGMQELIEELALEAIVVTLGPDGIAYQQSGGAPQYVPARALAVFDVSGAGDTVLAVLGLMLGGGHSVDDAVLAANEAGGVVVAKPGTALVTRDEIRQSIAFRLGTQSGKLVEPAQLVDMLAPMRARGMSVVFTNGCFDLIHDGHVTLLEQAKAMGDLLIVAINSDASVRRNKGEDRPVLGQTSRARVLGALEPVDYVVVFDEDTPEALLRQIEPDLLVKGADWRGHGGIVGAEIVEAYGGRAVYVNVVEGSSTTSMVAATGGEAAARRRIAAEKGRAPASDQAGVKGGASDG